MSAAWRRLRLEELLRRSECVAVVRPDATYQEITVRLWGKGVVQRGLVAGAEVNGRRFVARAGQLVLSRIDARNGALGVVPPNLDGALVSNDFPLFDVASDRLDSRWLEWLVKTDDFVGLCRHASEGTTNRVRLQEHTFLGIEVAAPPLEEQRRIVARIEQAAVAIRCATALRQQALTEGRAAQRSYLNAVIGDKWPSSPLQEVVEPTRPITYGIVQAGEHVPDGVPYIRVSDMAKPQLTLHGMLRTSHAIAARYERSKVRRGDIVFAIRATVGKMRIVPPELDGANLTQGTARIAPGPHVTADWLMSVLQSPKVTPLIQSAVKGSTFKEITLGRLRTIPVPVPPLPEQRQVLCQMAVWQDRLDALERLQAETALELDALLPSILDRAFARAL